MLCVLNFRELPRPDVLLEAELVCKETRCVADVSRRHCVVFHLNYELQMWKTIRQLFKKDLAEEFHLPKIDHVNFKLQLLRQYLDKVGEGSQ